MISSCLWVLLLGICAVSDWKRGKIPNVCCAGLVITGLLEHLFFGRVQDCGTSCLLAIAILLSGYLFAYRTGGLGAGDVKLLASAPIFLRSGDWERFFLTSLITALLWGILFILSGKKNEIRMAVPIFLGGLLTIGQPFFLPV